MRILDAHSQTAIANTALVAYCENNTGSLEMRLVANL
jgi:hypothetical protein